MEKERKRNSRGFDVLVLASPSALDAEGGLFLGYRVDPTRGRPRISCERKQ